MQRPRPSLRSIFHRLNHLYFEGRVQCHLIWGRIVAARVRRSRRLGSFNPRNGTVTLNPVLLKPSIPFFVLESVLHHEMCHSFVPPKRIGGRTYAHHRAFREKEREYKYFSEAEAWIKKNQKLLFLPLGPRRKKKRAI